ncbi:asparagine synthase (glutamine-hydrolyzing) [Tardiphaga sp. vice154]|uniref:asparagine synthase (glutamine-hydrolyzing) n=1 Tax=Tardiphaga sp. vice154 TaxID=2592814 RepID=UPI00116533B8|nr:asparagine synthase (glutamine-hydrolyzing) [Tardiphaga sp. vice154]QDM23006.1 asparagine synthase (glutamine-hydrolyzing) [Tardiphaga sp. vice154]
MCGIAGFIGRGDEAVLTAMTNSLAHRGPDGEGRYIDRENAVYLGHRRLAVIDIALGQQPMWNEDGLVGVVFNGMIYNHAALRTELVARGHVFRSHHSDTEVLVHGWEEWGFGLLGRLNGMFAFALLDRRASRLILARDRFGEKPLFYGSGPGGIVFASELSAILAHPSHGGQPMDPAAIRKYLAYGFFPAPLTPYRSIAKLPQGHALEIDIRTQETRLHRYWRFAIEADAAPVGDPHSLAEELDGLLTRAVALRLDSDRPLGIFLSGGLDSSTILSHAAQLRPAASIESFAIGFNEESFDESVYAAQMAKHVGSNHRTEMCDLETARALLADLPSIIDEPLGDSSILPTYMLCKFARRHVTVALSGDGGDELFAGYDPFKVLAKADLYHRVVPRPIHAAIATLAARMPPSDRNMSLDFKLNRGLRGLGLRPALWNPVWLGPASPSDIADLMSEPVDAEDLYSEAIAAWDNSASPGLVDRTLEFYTNFYLADDIMVKSDRAGMRNSLEVRAPFLDNDVADFARRLPSSVKLRGGVSKWVLRQSAARRLPANLLERRKKGFGIPLARWLRDMPEATLGKPPMLDAGTLHRFWQEHHDRQRDHRGALWCALTLQQSRKHSA